MNKNIVLIMPTVSDLSFVIEEALEYHGFNVITLNNFNKDKSCYPSFKAWCYAKYRKIFFGDKETTKKIKELGLCQRIVNELTHNEGDNYSLFIRSDMYSKELIENIGKVCTKGHVSYQFDGLHRYPLIYDRIDLFDKFYIFDPRDLQYSEALLPCTNFYFEHLIEDNPQIEYDFYYVGAHHPSRQELIVKFAQYVEQKNWRMSFNLYPLDIHDNPRHFYPNKNIHIIDEIIPFKENIKQMQKSHILIDFVIGEHKGLSFRVFESVGYRKKLITTNPDVALYDFYHPNNILILDGENFDLIDEFVQKPYYELPSEIYEKYNFANWIKYVLNIDSFIPLSLPEVNDEKYNNNILKRKKKIYLVAFDEHKPIGGIKQLYRFAEILNELGYQANIIHKKEGFNIQWFAHQVPVKYFPDLYSILDIESKPKLRHLKRFIQYYYNKIVTKSQYKLPEKDAILIVPEVLGLKLNNIPNYKKIIYNQNNHYTFSYYPTYEEVQIDPYVHKNTLATMTVSDYSYQYLQYAYPNAVLFNTGISLSNQFTLGKKPKLKKIAFMPRKLPEDSKQVLRILAKRPVFKDWQFIAIDNKSEHEVISILQESAIFMSFNHIEGFGLPPVEAMACGCYVIGYAGNAGLEYLKSEFSTPIPDLNILEFVKELERIVIQYNDNPEIFWKKGEMASAFVKAKYTKENEKMKIKAAFEQIFNEMS
ncbi:glycosyltransferase [Alysiella crassa]|uniref:Glycosyl transferases group 1 n=1 Tax=Alysiella crassa TaxID=153491 RepID=A0A376BN36_9NEIS|nr:glycosyltransferase [Alysiella crassa]UOP06798.1 glycosyltransferase [Alysiella crassa]SSY71080.1 Glycosyl transferases group 1 [Alysiella crassa]